MAAAALVSITAVATTAGAQDLVAEQFNDRVWAYLELRRGAAAHVPALRVTSNPRVIEQASDALASAIRAARRDAARGDVFDFDIAEAVRSRIAGALQQQHYPAGDLLLDLLVDTPVVPVRLDVNARFDWGFGTQMPGFLLAALPSLPPELQYRFVGPDLVIIDVDARLIVDVLPLALDVP